MDSDGDARKWLGADDIYEPNAVSTVVEFFKSNLDAYFVFGRCNLVDDKNRKISVSGIINYKSCYFWRGKQIVAIKILRKVKII